MRHKYLISFKRVGAKRWKIHPLRETNFRRAKKTLRTLLRHNLNYVIGRVEKVDSDEENLTTVYEVIYKDGKQKE